MRWGRVVFEAVLVLSFAITGFLLYIEHTRVRSPFLPRFFFAHDKDTLTVQGTWRREDGMTRGRVRRRPLSANERRDAAPRRLLS
jgi:hypothetical protein